MDFIPKRTAHRPDTKACVLKAHEDGGDWHLVADALGVNRKTAMTWIRRQKAGPSKFTHGGSRFRRLSDQDVQQLLAWIRAEPKLTLSALRIRLKTENAKDVSITTIRSYLAGKRKPIRRTLSKIPTAKVIRMKIEETDTEAEYKKPEDVKEEVGEEKHPVC